MIHSEIDFNTLRKLATRIRGGEYQINNGGISNMCNLPSTYILVHWELDLLLCMCDSWLPIPVGKVLDFNSIEEVFDSPIARELQQDIDDKKFTFCAVTHCGIMDRDILMSYTNLSINIDESCNLACPSCRREQKMLTDGEVFDLKLKSTERIVEWLEKYQEPIHITMSGNGDCLASHIMRPLIKTYKPRNTQTFALFTNGLLIKKVLPGAPIFERIIQFKISVDAGSAEVYEVVRQPGKWNILMENFDWLDLNRGMAGPGWKRQYVEIKLIFTVQQKNYQDLPKFIKLCQDRDYVPEITQLDDWATWSSPATPRSSWGVDLFTIKHGTFLENDILNPQHPEHQECINILKEINKIPHNIVFTSKIKALL